jgi:very-short-patch-repair endonuclease
MVKRDWDISRARAATPLPLKGGGIFTFPLEGEGGNVQRCPEGGDAPHPTMPSTFAPKLRVDATDAEIRLWAKLRRKQLDGFRFRRQQPIGRYIVDFFRPEAGLIVEVDGGQHAEESPARAAWLKSRGYCVIRCWNNEVLANTEGVVETIRGALRGAAPPPTARPTALRDWPLGV